MTELQEAIVAHEEERMLDPDSIQNGGVLVAMSHMRTAMVSPALLDASDYPEIENFPTPAELVTSSPKLSYVCDTVAGIYKEKPQCGQVIYVPFGVDHLDRIKDYLESKGIEVVTCRIVSRVAITGTPSTRSTAASPGSLLAAASCEASPGSPLVSVSCAASTGSI